MLRVFKAIDRALDRLFTGSGAAATGLVLLLAIFVAVNAFARAALRVNIRGLFDGAIYSLLIFTYLGAVYTLKEGKHIAVDVLTSGLSPRTQASLRICSHLVSAVFVIILGWQSWQWADRAFRAKLETAADFPIPQGILISVMVLGMLFLILQIIRSLVRDIGLLSRHKVPDQAPAPVRRDNPLLYVSLFIIGIIIGVALFFLVNPVLGLSFLLLVLLFGGTPVFFALGFLGCFGLYFVVGSSALPQIAIKAYATVSSFPLTCLPLFILGGMLMEDIQVAAKLFRFAELWTGQYASSLLVATILVGLIFCAISGSSTACTAAIAAVAMPLLLARGYGKGVAAGAVGGSTIGTIVPPSMGYVVYGVMTGESIAQLFMASIGPSIVIFAGYFLFVIIRGIVAKKSLFEQGQVPRQISQQVSVSWKDRFLALKDALWGLLTPLVVLGGIYAGIFTPTEAAAILVVYAIMVGLITKQFSWRGLLRATLATTLVTSMVMCIVLAAFIFALVVSQLQVSASVLVFIRETGLGASGLMGILFVLLLVLGFFLDSPSLKVTTLPIFYVPAMALGVNSLWLGIFYQIMGEIALLTPPVGLNLFIIQGISGVPLVDVIRGSIPYILIMILSLAAMLIFPELVTWLPAHMIK